MYQPVLKNKLNELKGLNDVGLDINLSPIIELTNLNKKNTIEDVINYITEKVPNIKGKKVYIDLPTYLYNELYDYFELKEVDNKCNFFLKIKEVFKKDIFFIPAVSFDYSYDNEKKSYKENIKFFKKMLKEFDNLAIRIFANNTFKNNDKALLSQIYDFLGDELENKNITIIIEVFNNNLIEILDILKEITSEYKINQITLLGEAFNNNSRKKTKEIYDRIKNYHLINFLELQKSSQLKFIYADYTLVDKIPTKIDTEQGFLYNPFIKFTTEDGNMCHFSAQEKGNYHQYKDLSRLIIEKVRNYSSEHCLSCKFIQDVEKGISNKFKAGAVWKHRMIAHHITTMANYFK